MGTTFEKELSRYDAVIFFETAAVGGVYSGLVELQKVVGNHLNKSKIHHEK